MKEEQPDLFLCLQKKWERCYNGICLTGDAPARIRRIVFDGRAVPVAGGIFRETLIHSKKRIGAVHWCSQASAAVFRRLQEETTVIVRCPGRENDAIGDSFEEYSIFTPEMEGGSNENCCSG